MTLSKKRDTYFDVLKGIGIISIVIGHCCFFASDFVYLYHLIIFFFIGAYFLLSETPCDPYSVISKLFKGVYLKYVLFGFILTAFHNVFYSFQLLAELNPYTFVDFWGAFANVLAFNCLEKFSGAMWFIVVYVLSIGISAFIIFFAENISKFFSRLFKCEKSFVIKHIVIILFTLFVGWIGVFLNEKKTQTLFNVHTALLVIPVCILGYYAKNYLDIKKLFRWYLLPVFAGLLVLFSCVLGYRIELSKWEIINFYMFYIVSVCGIAFCLCFADFLNSIPYCKNVFAVIGKYSFCIMAFHFLAFKITDRIYALIINDGDINSFGKWVVAYDNLWWVYIIVGVGLPVAFSLCFTGLKKLLFKSRKEAGKVE